MPNGGFSEIVEVALPIPLASTFHYGVPERLHGRARIGCRVVVPFGPRRLTGVVVRSGGVARSELRPIAQVLDAEPVLSSSWLCILEQAARDVFCPLGVALASALPAGSAPRPGRYLQLSERGREALTRGALRADLRPLLAALQGGSKPLSLAGWTRAGGTPGLARRLEREGLLRSVERERAPVAEPTVSWAALAPGVDLVAAVASLTRAPKQAALLNQIGVADAVPVSELETQLGGVRPALRALRERGLVRLEARPRGRRESAGELAGAGSGALPTLTDEQRAALDEIEAAVTAGRFERFLVHGVTGSGKTEVYLRAAAKALAAGREVLVLVPEITLTHQLLARLEARFGDRVAVLHSGLRPGERIGEWRRLLRGRTPIAIGARSALFAPLENLGLIVIDEEHDPAYKNEEGFRYLAHDLAARRAAESGCPLLMGSATPSLETRYAAERGELRRLVLSRRIGGRPLPAVEIVDLEAERAFLPRGRKLVLSRALHAAMSETLRAGAQTILFLNRRGFSTRVFCFECGHAERCEHCDVSLVFHAHDGRLRCHYCDFEKRPPDACSGCGAPETALLGIGTQRLEEEVRRAFPEARVARLDRDSAARRGTTQSVLSALASRKLDILIGTQMVTKGHDYPGVRLVGVIAADLSLHHPDFRAAERTFQLLTQVAGRAGRGGAPGRVILQTFAPDHYAIRPVVEHDYERFYRAELEQRQALGYPPVGQLLRVLVSAPDAEVTRAAAEQLATLARDLAGTNGGAPPSSSRERLVPSIEILGPAPAPLARLRDRERVQLLVKTSEEKRLREIGAALAERARELETREVRIAVDPHPVHML